MSVYAVNLLRELVSIGYDLTMVSQYRGDEVGTRVYGGGPPPPLEGVRIIGLESVGEQDGGNFERDIELIVETIVAEHRKQPFDLLHAQYGYPTGFAALIAAKRLNLPNVVSIQGGDGHWVGTCCRTHQQAMRVVLDHSGAVLIGSPSFAAEVNQNHGTNMDRFTIVPGAVDTNRFKPRSGWRPGAFLNPAMPVLLYHGRVDRRKGALDLIQAFSIVRDLTDARLEISGIGPDVNAVAETVSKLELTDRVSLPGYCAYGDVPAVYQKGDIFLSPTYAEGFSNTILEAMASGLPIISTFAVGVVDCLRDGENALLIEPGDIAALAESMSRLLGDNCLQAQLAENALDEVRKVYSWPVIAQQIASVYEQLFDTVPDTGWAEEIPIEPCRFRTQPHLL